MTAMVGAVMAYTAVMTALILALVKLLNPRPGRVEHADVSTHGEHACELDN